MDACYLPSKTDIETLNKQIMIDGQMITLNDYVNSVKQEVLLDINDKKDSIIYGGGIYTSKIKLAVKTSNAMYYIINALFHFSLVGGISYIPGVSLGLLSIIKTIQGTNYNQQEMIKTLVTTCLEMFQPIPLDVSTLIVPDKENWLRKLDTYNLFTNSYEKDLEEYNKAYNTLKELNNSENEKMLQTYKLSCEESAQTREAAMAATANENASGYTAWAVFAVKTIVALVFIAIKNPKVSRIGKLLTMPGRTVKLFIANYLLTKIMKIPDEHLIAEMTVGDIINKELSAYLIDNNSNLATSVYDVDYESMPALMRPPPATRLSRWGPELTNLEKARNKASDVERRRGLSRLNSSDGGYTKKRHNKKTKRRKHKTRSRRINKRK